VFNDTDATGESGMFNDTDVDCTQVQLLVSDADVESYKQIKLDLDELRLLVEKSELWVYKSVKTPHDKNTAEVSDDNPLTLTLTLTLTVVVEKSEVCVYKSIKIPHDKNRASDAKVSDNCCHCLHD